MSKWSLLLVNHMSKKMCKTLIPFILEKAGFEPPKIREFNYTPKGYYQHNLFYNYVISFIGG